MIRTLLAKPTVGMMNIWLKLVKTAMKLRDNQGLNDRKLEIGPGMHRLSGFETLDIRSGADVDYVLDASEPLPFKSDSFSVIYASHVLEHIPWYKTEAVLREWVRVLNRGGRLEIWVPDGVKICKTFLDAELSGEDHTALDGWYRYNDAKDPCVWAAGRIFSYGDGTGKTGHPNWHHAIFSRRYLTLLLHKVGLQSIREMRHDEVRGYDHKWINMGLTGTKP